MQEPRISDSNSERSKTRDDFAAQAQGPQSSFLGEILAFLRFTRKWWLAPVLVLLLFIGLLVMLGGTAVAPFIYTLF